MASWISSSIVETKSKGIPSSLKNLSLVTNFLTLTSRKTNQNYQIITLITILRILIVVKYPNKRAKNWNKRLNNLLETEIIIVIIPIWRLLKKTKLVRMKISRKKNVLSWTLSSLSIRNLNKKLQEKSRRRNRKLNKYITLPLKL